MADLKDFAEQLVNLSVKEVSELANILKDEYGIEPAAAAAPVMVAGAAGGDADGGAEAHGSRWFWQVSGLDCCVLTLTRSCV